MKLTKENLDFLRANLTPKDLIDLVAMKSRMNNRKKKGGKLDESFGNRENNDNIVRNKAINLFKNFVEDNLSREEVNTMYMIFNKEVSEAYSNIIYEEFMRFLSNVDKKLISKAQ